MNDKDECISENIHDADSQQNEYMVHWLHKFLRGSTTKEKLEEIFKGAYDDGRTITPPWNC